MGKIIDINDCVKDNRKRTYSDVEFVLGLLNDRNIQYALYRHWERYFNDHAGAGFFHLDEHRLEIIHNAYKVLWRNVKYGKIYVQDGVIMGKDGLPFKGTLTTYLWRVAINNNLELWRGETKMLHLEDLTPKRKVDCDDDNISVMNVISAEPIEESPFLISTDEKEMREIVAELIANMSERCNQILTLFYYQGVKLDGIMELLPTFKSKDALKTAKNKCMDRLKTAATKRYKEYLNS